MFGAGSKQCLGGSEGRGEQGWDRDGCGQPASVLTGCWDFQKSNVCLATTL